MNRLPHPILSRWFALAVCCFVSGAFAQNRQVSGTVTDGNGAAIPGARVTVTPTSQTAATNSDGAYQLTLAPGTYTVKVEAAGFGTVETQTTIPADRTRYLDVTLAPASQGSVPVIVTTVDAASSRPGYLPASELTPGSIFTAYGASLSAAGARARIRGADGSTHEFTPFFTSPAQVSGIIPSTVQPGNARLELTGDGSTQVTALVRIVDSKPAFFTLDQSGSGAGIFTDAIDFSLVTRASPARPGRLYTAWLTSGGAVDNDQRPAIRDRRPGYQDYQVRLGNTPLAASDIFYAGPSGIPGLDQLNFRVPASSSLSGCDVPVQFGVRTAGSGVFAWGNEVTIPIASSGNCGDRFGFAAEDHTLLNGAGIANMEGAVTETTFLFSNRAQQNAITGRLTGYQWTNSVYRAPPDETCQLRWLPPGVPAVAANPLAFAGSVTMTLPWGQVALSPGTTPPYVSTSQFPSSFTTGDYTFSLPASFTVERQPLNLEFKGSYARPAGLARESLVSRFTTIPAEPEFAALVQSLLNAAGQVPGSLRSQLNADFTVQISNGTLGTHNIRCLGDSAGDLNFMARAIESYTPLLPKTAAVTNISFRYFPKERIRFNGAGPVNRILVSFDSTVVFSDLGVKFRQ